MGVSARYADADYKLRERLKAVGWVNGCGPGSASGLVPDFMWEEDCDEHDFDYFVGGSEVDRREADWRFSMRMILRANNRYAWWDPRRFFARMGAWSYYRAVKELGDDLAFCYRPKPLTMARVLALLDEEEERRRVR